MNAFQDLICRMKIAQHDLQTLHHYMQGGGGAWLSAHEQIGGYYEQLAAMTDDLVEIGLSVGIDEPGIKDAVDHCPPTVPSQAIETGAALAKALDILGDIADRMQAIGDQLEDDERYIQSKLDDFIYDLRKETAYKLSRAVG